MAVLYSLTDRFIGCRSGGPGGELRGEHIYRRAATYVDKILKGAKPSDLLVMQATTFDLVINLKTTTALGLQLPAAFIARATDVIE